MAWLAAIELLGPSEVGDIRRAARATLAPQPERIAEFDALFDAHFLGALGIGLGVGTGAKTSRCARPRIPPSAPSRFSARTCSESGAGQPARKGLPRAASRPEASSKHCAASAARCRPMRREGAAIGGVPRAADTKPMRGACFAMPCAMPASSSAFATAGAARASAASCSLSTYPAR